MALDPNVPSQNYPFVTQDGEVIPLDILKPKTCYLQDISVGVTDNISIAESTGVAIIYSSVDCLVSFGADITSIAYNTPYTDSLFVPKKHMITITVEDGNVYMRPLTENGFVSIQFIERWAGLAPDLSFSRR
jgi:hypothetical protein